MPKCSIFCTFFCTRVGLEIVNAPVHAFSGDVKHALAHIEEVTVHDIPAARQRWYAIKRFEQDEKVLAQLQLSLDDMKGLKILTI